MVNILKTILMPALDPWQRNVPFAMDTQSNSTEPDTSVELSRGELQELFSDVLSDGSKRTSHSDREIIESPQIARNSDRDITETRQIDRIRSALTS